MRIMEAGQHEKKQIFYNTLWIFQKSGVILNTVVISATPWCNGSTTGFGPVSLGSNPGGVAIFLYTKICLENKKRGFL